MQLISLFSSYQSTAAFKIFIQRASGILIFVFRIKDDNKVE